ncbi:MAG: exodeoxyribonuclease VII small subunit [Marinilabiliales bacterium]|nr:exodeoxyribonuclease VII small subunit [Marinilabiliales bacterium]
MNGKKGLSYKEAIREIEEILLQIEKDEPDVDQLSEKVKRLSSLISVCREKLVQTENEIEKILQEIEKS